MVKIPDKDSLRDHNWNSPRGVANFDAAALAAPGRAMQGVGQQIASLGKSIGGAIDASAAGNSEADKYETARKFIDFDIQQNDYLTEQQRNIAPDGTGFRDGVSSNYETRAREFFKGVPDALKPEYDYKLRQRARDYELKSRDIELNQQDTFHKNEIASKLQDFTARMDDEPDNFREWVGRGVNLIENSRLPAERKQELIRKFGADSESRHIEQRLQRGEDAEEIRKDILQRQRPFWDQSVPRPANGGGAGPRSDAGAIDGGIKPVLSDAQREKLKGVNSTLVDKLSLLQGVAGREFNINSGYRDPDHNARVGGAKKSQHIHGNAVDLDVSGLSNEERIKVIEQASSLGFTGIGVYKTAIHLDLGNRRSWGADYGRDSVPSWAEGVIKQHEVGRLASNAADQKSVATGALPDFRDKDGPASVRYNNPGAMYPGPSSKKYGAVETKVIGGGHKIAVFPDAVSGAAAQFDLLSDKYTGRTLEDAISKWSGGNSVGTYLKVIERETGLTPDTTLTKEMVADPRIAIPIAKAMAVQEAGKAYPMDDAQWAAAHQRFAGGDAPPVSQRSLTQYAGHQAESRAAALSNGAGKGNVRVAALGPEGTDERPEAEQNLSGYQFGAMPQDVVAEANNQANGVKQPVADGVARVTSGGQIVTLLDGISDSTPLSKVPADVRAKIEELAPADALKPRTVNGERVAATDIVTVGDIKAGLTEAMKGEAKNQAARTGAGMALAEADTGLAGRSPKFQYRWLSQQSADKALHKIEISQRNKFKQMGKGEVEYIKRYGEESLDASGRSLMDRAKDVLTPNQMTKLRQDIDAAKWYHRMIRPIGDMPEDRIEAHLEKMQPTPADSANLEVMEMKSKAHSDALKAADKVRELRRKDGALAVESSREVREARMAIKQAVSQTATMGQRKSGVIGFDIEDRPEMSPARAWETLIDARLEAQERVFGDRDDPRIRAVTRREAEQLMKFTDASSMSEDELLTRLQQAAARAEKTYGKHGAKAFQDSVRMLVRSKEGAETAAGLAQKVFTGQRITANDLHRYQLMEPLDGSEAFARSRQLGWNDAKGPTLDGLRPAGGKPVPMTPSQPALAAPGNTGPAAVQHGVPVTMQMPSKDAVMWLLQDPGRNSAAFDKRFGQGMAGQVMSYAQSRMKSVGSQGSQPTQMPDLGILAPYP